MKRVVSFVLNGDPASLDVDPRRRLPWMLRSDPASPEPGTVAVSSGAEPALSWSTAVPSSPAPSLPDPAVLVGAALANAIHDALGVRGYELPMTPERIRRAMAEA